LLKQRPSKSTLAFFFLACVLAQTLATLFLGSSIGIIVVGALVALCLALLLHMYFTLSGKLDAQIDLTAVEHVKTTRQIQSLMYIYSSLSLRRPLPPMRDMAISPDFAATLVSTILERRPKTILEFGSGTSTLLSSYCLEQIGSGKIISIDHEGQYAEQTRESLRNHGVDRYAEVIHAPLRELSLPTGKWKWYDTAFLESLPEIDLLVVDGPPAWLQSLARYPALPVLRKHLSHSAIVLIDDADRPDEQEMVKRWLAEFAVFSRSSLLHEKGTVLLTQTPADISSNASRRSGALV
jgi:predicted O-methyltransferase YrrM